MKKLFGASCTIMVFTFVAYRIATGMNVNLDIFFLVREKQIHIDNDAKNIPCFIRNILKQLFAILYTDDSTVIIGSNIYFAALSVCKTTNPF